MIGGIGGALAGGLIGGNWKGALIGASAGAALGAGVRYCGALQQQNRDQAAIYSRVQGDLTQEGTQIDRTRFAFNRLMDCRFAQAQGVRASYGSARIDRPGALDQMAALRQHAGRDLAVATRINGQINTRAQQFAAAADNLSPGTGTSPRHRDRPAVVRRTSRLKLTTDAQAPDIGRLNRARKRPRSRDAVTTRWCRPPPIAPRGGPAPGQDIRTQA